MQLAATVGTGNATTTSKPELRESLEKETKLDLIEKCKAAGISGYSNKRKEELIDLLLRKKPRLDEQVHSAGIMSTIGVPRSTLRSAPSW